MPVDTLFTHNLFTLAQAPAGNPLMQFAPMILLIVGFYFLIIAPQRKKQKAHDKMLSELKNGDDVITTGGIYGTISNVKSDRITVKIAENTRIDITKNSILSKINKDKEDKTS